MELDVVAGAAAADAGDDTVAAAAASAIDAAAVAAVAAAAVGDSNTAKTDVSVTDPSKNALISNRVLSRTHTHTFNKKISILPLPAHQTSPKKGNVSDGNGDAGGDGDTRIDGATADLDGVSTPDVVQAADEKNEDVRI